jgi:hypothetical protein
MKIIKASFLHKVGNIIGGFAAIIDGLILILSIGNISASLQLRFSIFRLKSKKSKN